MLVQCDRKGQLYYRLLLNRCFRRLNDGNVIFLSFVFFYLSGHVQISPLESLHTFLERIFLSGCYLHNRKFLGLLLRGTAGNLGYNHENPPVHLGRRA